MTMLAALVSLSVSWSLTCSDDAGSSGGAKRLPLALARFVKAGAFVKLCDQLPTSTSQNTPLPTPRHYANQTQISSSTHKSHLLTAKTTTMPPVRTARASKKAPPEGFEDIEDTLLEFQNKMKDSENASHEGKKKYEMTWPVFQITHQRSRYIYDLYYEKEAISKPLYDYLLKNGYADPMLIAKWKKQGYEKVCDRK